MVSLWTNPVLAGSFHIPKPPKPAPRPEPAPAPTPPAPSPAPAPTPAPPAPTPAPTPQPPPSSGEFDLYSDVAHVVGERVDRYYGYIGALMDQRSDYSTDRSDTCNAEVKSRDQFAERIAYYVDEHIAEEFKPRVDVIASYYNFSSDLNTHAKVSLKSHPLCSFNRAELAHTIGDNRVPSQDVIDKLNQFSGKYNTLRQSALKGSVESRKELTKLWTKFMGCLSYVESLTTADTSSSQRVADKHGPSGYRKPAGVKFSEDPYQPEASRLNISRFQFTPN